MVKPRRLFISFSGGESSAMMTAWCLVVLAPRYDEVVILFANTGSENEETLEFVRRCAEHWGVPVIWVEAVVHHGRRKSSTHRVVDFETASRKNEPYEEMVKKYGIPNRAWPHCTRELKLRPMKSYLKSIGWKDGTYDTAVGIRVDEIDRIDPNYEALRLIYPLAFEGMCPSTKPQVNTYWRAQPFRLYLTGYRGNCVFCWKKSLRKHLTLISECPEVFSFTDRMEREHGMAGHNEDGQPRVFFREKMSTRDLFTKWAEGGWENAPDDADVYMGMPLDTPDGCTESCEVNWGEKL